MKRDGVPRWVVCSRLQGPRLPQSEKFTSASHISCVFSFFFFSRSYISRCGFEIIFMSRHQRLARVTTRVRYILYQVECYVRNVCVLFGHLTCPLLSIKFWNNKLPIIYVYVFDAKNCYN